ncbi:MAG: cell division protein FtsL [Christensenellaceae bacterium]|nr:cell division protein FtsL [Christensenellaceae bacterium]
MAALRKVANGYGYGSYVQPEFEYEYAAIQESEWDILPERKVRKTQRAKVEEKVEVTYQVHPETAARRRRALTNCLLILVCFVMLSAVVAGYSAIAKTNLENIQLQENIDNLEEQVDKLSVNIASKSDITSVAAVAEEELAMSFPDASQVRYLSVAAAGEAEPADTAEQADAPAEEEGFFASIWNAVCSLFV